MSPQMGRPKSENPRKKQLGVRFDDEELRKLDEVAEHYNETRVESIRRGVEKLYSEIKKQRFTPTDQSNSESPTTQKFPSANIIMHQETSFKNIFLKRSFYYEQSYG